MTAVGKDKRIPWQAAADRRSALLSRLSLAPRQLAAERRALPAGAEARINALLTEIDESVLPRLLLVRAGGREAARLTVSHRRLIAVDLPGQPPLRNDAGDLVALCAARLVDIAGLRGDLSLGASRRAAAPTHAETACSVTALTQALGFAATQSAHDRLLARVQAQAVALLLWSERPAPSPFSGAAEWRTALQTFAENHRKLGKAHPADARLGPLRSEGLAIPLSAAHILMTAGLDKSGFAAILPRQAGLDLIAAWQVR